MSRIAKQDIGYLYRKEGETITVNLSPISREDTFIRIKSRMKILLDFVKQSENWSDLPNILSDKFQFKRYNYQAGKDSDVEYQSQFSQYYHSMDRLVNVAGAKDVQFELVRIPNVEDQPGAQLNGDPYDCYGLYLHPDQTKEWRPCKVLMKLSKPPQEEKYAIEYKHQPGRKYVCFRQDVLLSYEYKRTKEGFYQEEVVEFLDKLDKDEVAIAEILHEQDVKGHTNLNEIKRQLQFEQEMKIGNKDLDDDKIQEDDGDDNGFEFDQH